MVKLKLQILLAHGVVFSPSNEQITIKDLTQHYFSNIFDEGELIK